MIDSDGRWQIEQVREAKKAAETKEPHFKIEARCGTIQGARLVLIIYLQIVSVQYIGSRVAQAAASASVASLSRGYNFFAISSILRGSPVWGPVYAHSFG